MWLTEQGQSCPAGAILSQPSKVATVASYITFMAFGCMSKGQLHELLQFHKFIIPYMQVSTLILHMEDACRCSTYATTFLPPQVPNHAQVLEPRRQKAAKNGSHSQATGVQHPHKPLCTIMTPVSNYTLGCSTVSNFKTRCNFFCTNT